MCEQLRVAVYVEVAAAGRVPPNHERWLCGVRVRVSLVMCLCVSAGLGRRQVYKCC